ncbi:DUF1440 domain-containing protein [Flavobacterium sp. F-65]|uniref:DUF1440 domain-containing protein n=1 Tax=Flavobacterium pisciphilum TaxID=2893755 RepID=A0ABS8MNT5_9FLAO|nr:DUF1440 domain-containing protein [Flavobacterium sp. F-65]MCC9070429.1 DUF1440 domain-containing protein [Flavobacterium sp. F-65]
MKSKVGTVLLSGLVAGAMDIISCIIIYVVILQKTTTTKILLSIASGIFKKDAYSGDPKMAFYGLGIHFIIATLFALFYFKIYPYIPFLKKNTLLSGFIYGIFVWIVMNLIVLPIAFPILPPKHLDFPLLLSILILMFCIGLPVAFITKKYYAYTSNR